MAAISGSVSPPRGRVGAPSGRRIGFPMPLLIAKKGTSFHKEFAFPSQDFILIGRAQTNDVVLPDATRKVSRYHAALIRSPGESAYFIRDLGSLHSTRVSGQAVDRKTIDDDDVIEIGDYKLVYSLDSIPGQALGCLRVVSKKAASPPHEGSTMGLPPEAVAEFGSVTGQRREVWEEIERASRHHMPLAQRCAEVVQPLVHALKAGRGFARIFRAGRVDAYRDVGMTGLSEGEQIEISEEAYLVRVLEGRHVQDGGTLIAPVQSEGKLAAFLCVDRCAPDLPFDNEETAFLLAVSRLLSMANYEPGDAEPDEQEDFPEWPTNLVGKSRSMQQLFREIEEAASSGLNTLIQGESGTGKELAARAIHERSPRAKGPFIPRNCGQTTESLAESEIFGYAPRAGIADANPLGAPGWFEMADKGTIFLDELHRLNPAMQDKLLRVLQDKEVWRIGARSPVYVSLQVVAATDEDLRGAVNTGLMRKPFYFRFAKRITLPPLRERKEDIPLLACYFVDKYANETGANARGLSHSAVLALLAYDWPGNVRELENAIRLSVSKGRAVILTTDLPKEIQHAAGSAGSGTAEASDDAVATQSSVAPKPVSRMGEIEKVTIMEALRSTGGNITAAGELLGFKSRQTMLNKMDRHGIPRNYGDPASR
jgi:DNA-binding NtrC family response regulator